MKIFKNISLQGFSVPFSTPEGIKYVFIAPKNSFETPDSWSSKVAVTLVTRRMFKITSIADPAPVPVTDSFKAPAPKRIKSTPKVNR